MQEETAAGQSEAAADNCAQTGKRTAGAADCVCLVKEMPYAKKKSRKVV
ncbi:MAG: hypothetical protein ACLRIL_05520 [Fusicatenibacter saccharivorans]